MTFNRTPRSEKIVNNDKDPVRLTLSDRELTKISSLIYQRAGIVITSQKHDMVFNRLSRRLRVLKLINFTQYIALLEQDLQSDEWQAFINALTTNLTSFFREAYHFPLLAKHAGQQPSGYSVWCTAASTGEEAYSIAMTLEAALGKSKAGPRIWATDIDTDVLQKAQMGIYRASDLGNLTAEQKKNWFLRGTGDKKGQVKVNPLLRETIHFQQLNLLADKWDVPGPFDAIFCRNVMIYFDQKTQQRLLQRFANMLKPDGILFTGHSESLSQFENAFRLRGQSVYSLIQENK